VQSGLLKSILVVIMVAAAVASSVQL